MATATNTLNFAPAPQWTRQQIEDAIELLIAQLDAIDGDPDLEPENDGDPDEDVPCPVINLWRGDLDEHRHASGFVNEDGVPHYGVDQDGPRLGEYGAADSFGFVTIAERVK